MSVLLIIGASARAAVASARQSSWTIHAMDMFGDIDTRSQSNFHLLNDYPTDCLSLLSDIRPDAICVTGAMENYPNILQELATRTTLLAPAVDQIARMRDPSNLQSVLTSSNWQYPRTFAANEHLPDDETLWLTKPIASAAGQGIHPFDNTDLSSPEPTKIIQERISGRNISVSFLMHPSRTDLLGCTEQLLGHRELQASEFQYCGSIGPLHIPPSIQKKLQELGQFLQHEYSLRGLIGVDLILHDDQLWLIEINPRYTASMELFESQFNRSMIQLHLDSFSKHPATFNRIDHANIHYGKAVLFARETTQVPNDFQSIWQAALNCQRPTVADLPPIGAIVEAGHPLFTIFAHSGSTAETRAKLHQQATSFYNRLHAA
ncbi:MAG: ATP-grasp domain-containing protein [Pirellulaceae bacterium]|nr:ATP-grasp domain-containing protein [Pirellulaceae bacterium]